MAYTTTNFKTKKALKQALMDGQKIPVYQPNDMFGDGTIKDGTCVVEGPHYPECHRWYAEVVVHDGVIIKVT